MSDKLGQPEIIKGYSAQKYLEAIQKIEQLEQKNLELKNKILEQEVEIRTHDDLDGEIEKLEKFLNYCIGFMVGSKTIPDENYIKEKYKDALLRKLAKDQDDG